MGVNNMCLRQRDRPTLPIFPRPIQATRGISVNEDRMLYVKSDTQRAPDGGRVLALMHSVGMPGANKYCPEVAMAGEHDTTSEGSARLIPLELGLAGSDILE